MKIKKAKKKNARWIITVETIEEEQALLHTFGCRDSLSHCVVKEVRDDVFQARFYEKLRDFRG
jgi:hypothetical protein